MQIHVVGIHLFHEDRQIDMMKLMVTLHNYFVYAPKKEAYGNCRDTCGFMSALFLLTLWILKYECVLYFLVSDCCF
jgi:hypothetical protein